MVEKEEEGQIPSKKGACGKELDDEPYYHGFMARDQAERLVVKEGEFLLRKNTVHGFEVQ